MGLEDLGINDDVRSVVKNKEYKSRSKIYGFLQDNVVSFLGASIGGGILLAGIRYIGSNEGINNFIAMGPIFYSAAATSLTDLIEFSHIKKTKGNIVRTIQNDLGNFSGQSLAYGLFIYSLL